MPSKRIIALVKNGDQYQYALWADVPAGNQVAFRNPTASSAFQNATPAEIVAIREGQVTERVGLIGLPAGSPLSQLQTDLEAVWTAFQAEVTASAPYQVYGRHWPGAGGAWITTTAVPMPAVGNHSGDLPSYWALSGVSAYGANKLHFVLFNGVTSMQALQIRIRLIVVLPQLAAVTGALGGEWILRRRDGPTTAPAGGTFAIVKADSADPTYATISAHNAPTTAPAGGTLETLGVCIPQPDEVKASTLDLPGLVSTNDYGGLIVYNAGRMPFARPWTLRPNQTLELAQSATAGAGNCRVLCVFTVG